MLSPRGAAGTRSGAAAGEGFGLVRGHRAHVAVPRAHSKRVVFTADELALIEQASTKRGLRAGAYVAAAAVDAAKAATNPAGGGGVDADQLRALTAEVREVRRLLGNVAGNLNDVARRANTGGELGPQADAVLAHTRAMNTRLDDWLMTMLRLLR